MLYHDLAFFLDISKKNESIHSHKNLYMDVHSSIIHFSQKVEITQKAIYYMSTQ